MSDPTARTARIVTGALRDAISRHGPVTIDNVGSAVKRVVGQLRNASARALTGDPDLMATVDALTHRLAKLRYGHDRLRDQHNRLLIRHRDVLEQLEGFVGLSRAYTFDELPGEAALTERARATIAAVRGVQVAEC